MILRSEKKKYYFKQLQRYKFDMKNTWNVLKQAMNVSSKHSAIDNIKLNDEIISDPVHIANVFNSYFSKMKVKMK